MHILTFTSLFPNSQQTEHGVFIRSRMEAFHSEYQPRWSVVAPVPYYPALPFRTIPRYDRLVRVPSVETDRGYSIYHPRYLVTPRVGMRWYGDWMHRCVRSFVERLHRRDSIDIIDAHYVFPDGYAAALIAAELKVPLVVSARGSDLTAYSRLAFMRPRLSKVLRACNHLICVSKQLAEIALELGAKPDSISVIPNGVDLKNFYSIDRVHARERLGIPKDEIILLSVGHLIERKGFDFALKALKNLKNSNLRLIIIGDGELRRALLDLRSSLQLELQVDFVGAVANDHLAGWYAAADFFILASRAEGFPNAVCEALAMGLPVIGTSIPGTREIVCSDRLGVLAKERTVASLTDAIEYAISRTWDRAYIQEVGRKRTWKEVARELYEIFSKL